MDALPSPPQAIAVATELLKPLGKRWLHTQAVAHKADRLLLTVPTEDRTLLVVSAWWHDLGYAPDLALTGLHPLDGARYLAHKGYSERLCALVAHHSAAVCEANERGLALELAVWPQEESAVTDALWTADMTTGPTGEHLAYDERLSEILSRYTPESAVGRAMSRARPMIEGAIGRTESRLADVGLRLSNEGILNT